MSTSPAVTPLKYLDQALNKLRDLGLVPEKSEDAPIIALINKISDFDQERAVAIARTLNQASLFNQVVREQIDAMRIGQRYEDMAKSFNGIRDDAKRMVDQLDDGTVGFLERVQNVWMKVARGDIPARFQKIKETYLDVAKDSKDQIERERLILDAYRDFRGALKEAEVQALNILNKAEAQLNTAKQKLQDAGTALSQNTSTDREAIAKLELARDERLRELQQMDERYQIAKDLVDNLTISYNTTETIMARLLQTTNAKERDIRSR